MDSEGHTLQPKQFVIVTLSVTLVCILRLQGGMVQCWNRSRSWIYAWMRTVYLTALIPYNCCSNQFWFISWYYILSSQDLFYLILSYKSLFLKDHFLKSLLWKFLKFKALIASNPSILKLIKSGFHILASVGNEIRTCISVLFLLYNTLPQI